MFELIPEYFRDRDLEQTKLLFAEGPLQRFFRGFGWAYDFIRTEYDSLMQIRDLDHVSGGLLPLFAQQFGITYEPELGMRQMRRWLRDTVYLYKVKGSRKGIEGLASAMTGWPATVTLGPNILPDTDTGTFTNSVGYWLRDTPNSKPATLTFGEYGPASFHDINYLRVESSDATDQSVQIATSLAADVKQYGIPVTVGSVYTASIYSRGNTATVPIVVKLHWYDKAGTLISTFSSTATTNTTTSWTRMTLANVTAPANSVWVIMAVEIQSGTAAVDQFFDAAQLEQATAATDYGQPRNILIDLEGERVNLVPNPSFEIDLVTWNNLTNATLARDTTQFRNGVASMSLTAVAAGTMSAHTLPADRIPVSPSATYTLSAYFRPDTTARNVRVYVRWYDSGSVYLSDSTYGAEVVQSMGVWTRAFATVTSPSNAAYAGVVVQIMDSALGEIHFVDSVLFEKGNLLLDYFDGSFLPVADHMFEGTTHDSPTHYYRKRAVKNQRLGSVMKDYVPLGATFTLKYANQ